MKDKYTLLLEQLESDLKEKENKKDETEQKLSSIIKEITISNCELGQVNGQLDKLYSDKKAWNTVTQRKKKKKISFVLSSLFSLFVLLFFQYVTYKFNVLNEQMLSLFDYPFSLKNLFIMCDIGGSGWFFSFYYRQIFKKYKKDNSDIDAIFSKYSSLEDIEHKIGEKQKKKNYLINKIQTLTKEKSDLRFLLTQINIDISTLKGKIGLTKEAFLAKCKILNNFSFERQLDEQFTQEGFDTQLAILNAEVSHQSDILSRTKPNSEEN